VDLPDVNILIYAFRVESPHYERCNAWLKRTVDSDTPFGLSPLTLSALVRITTNRRLFSQPSTHDEAFDFCEDLMAQPHCRLIEPGQRHWDTFRRLCVETNITGSDVTDVWYAALAIEHGCDWITFDRDFARFRELRCREP
jgi:uncharacterized protein